MILGASVAVTAQIGRVSMRVIVLGATGMVGEGVLHECLQHEDVYSALAINRRPCGVEHEKFHEIIHADFFDFSPLVPRLAGYDACFFCMGVSSLGWTRKSTAASRTTSPCTSPPRWRV